MTVDWACGSRPDKRQSKREETATKPTSKQSGSSTPHAKIKLKLGAYAIVDNQMYVVDEQGIPRPFTPAIADNS